MGLLSNQTFNQKKVGLLANATTYQAPKKTQAVELFRQPVANEQFRAKPKLVTPTPQAFNTLGTFKTSTPATAGKVFNPVQDIAVGVIQGTARAYGAAGQTVLNAVSGGKAGPLIPKGTLGKALYGTNEPVTLQSTGEELPFVKKGSKLAPFLAVGALATDLIGAGGAKNVYKAIAQVDNVAAATKLAAKLKVPEALIPKAADLFVKAKNVDEAEKAFKAVTSFSKVPIKPISATTREAETMVKTNLKGLVNQYVKKYGHVVNTDDARELFPGYQANRALSADVHESASTVAKATYDHLLDTRKGVGNNTVLFTAGGTGVGKTSAVNSLGNPKDFSVIYDTNMASLGSAAKKIDQALSKGYNAEINFIYNDIETSLKNALSRASNMEAKLGSGRTVPLAEHIKTHVDSPKTYLELYNKYKNPLSPDFNPKVSFVAIDNTGNITKKIDNPIDFVNKRMYNGVNDKQLAKQLEKQIEDAFQAGRISNTTRGGFVGTKKQGELGLQTSTGARLADGGGIAKAPEVNAPRFAVAAKDSPELSLGTKAEIELRSKATVTNRETLELAKARVAKSPEEAARFVLAKGEPSAEKTATAIELMRHYDLKGDAAAAADIAEHVADDLVKGGQFIQAAKLLERLTPEGVLVSAQKVLKQVNKKLLLKGKVPLKLGDDFANKITDLARARQAATDPLLKEELGWEISMMLASLKKATIGEKVSMFQTIMQLLNPKTLLTRNPLGNEIFYRVERLNKYIASPIDFARSKLTGGERTITFRTAGQQGAYWKNWLRGTRAGWKGVTPGMLPTQLDVGRQVFKSNYNPLKWGEKLLGAGLRGFDFAAYSRAKNQTIGELAYLKAINEGKRGSAAMEAAKTYAKNLDDNLLEIADKYGRYITFQDDNFISLGLSAIKKGLNAKQSFGLGDLALKYPRTPGALLMRAIEYSPAGFVRSAYLMSEPFIKGGKADSREVALALSRAITGTLGFTGMGYYLADKGIITGKSDKDKDVRALERQVGGGQFKINLSALKRFVMSGFKDTETKEGDVMYSYDWAQPVAIAVSMGANINNQLDEGKMEAAGLATTALSSVEGGINTLVEQPLLQGIKRIFGYGDIIGGLTQTAQGALSSLVPTLSSQLNQWIDNTRRNAYDPDILKQGVNYAKMKIPGFAQTVNPLVDTFGQTGEVYQGNSNNLFNVFLNPGFITRFATTPESQLVLDVIEATGDKTVAPRIVADTVNDKPLTADEYEQFQREVGTRTLKAFGEFAQSEAFMALPDAEKADLMASTLTNIGKQAKDTLFKTDTASAVEPTDHIRYLEIQELLQEGKDAEADQIVNGMSDEEFEAYKSVRSSDRAKNTKKLRELLRQNPADAVLFVRSLNKREQERLLDVMTDEEYAKYQLGK